MTRQIPLITLLFSLLGLSTVFCQDKIMPAQFGPDAERALKSNTDVLGEEVLASGEPSFSRVDHYFPAMKRPRVIVGVKEHPEFIGVAWDGTLDVGSVHPGQSSVLYLNSLYIS